MAPTQRVKNGGKPSTTETTQRIETRKEVRDTQTPPKQRATEQAMPISKQREWKLLYAPYPIRSADNNTSPMKGPVTRSSAEEEDSARYKGLCRNCKKQETCELPRPEGGVWRCEDYE